MDEIQILGYTGALAIGLVLGLMGSGGSLMAVPIFAYIFHLSPVTTTAYSLFVVGTSAAVPTLQNLKTGLINVRLALIFGIPAFISVYGVRRYLMPALPENWLVLDTLLISRDKVIMVLFGLLLLAAALTMIYKRISLVKSHRSTKCNFTLLIFEGILVGSVTGIVGIGGGFLIIPALVFLLKIPIKEAIATSLFIIAFKSLIGFLGDMAYLEINWFFLLVFTVLSIFGILLGRYFSSYIHEEKLQRGFGWFALTMAIFVLHKELF